MSSWHSYDKVDWSFSGPGFNGTAFLYSDQEYDDSPAHLTVQGFSVGVGAHHLHQILWATKKQFPNTQLRCLYRKEQASHLDKLAELRLVTWKHVESSKLGEVEILFIETPATGKPRIHTLPSLIWGRLKKCFGPT
jgi:hypothetical protein